MNYPIEDHIINFLAREESPEDVQNLKNWLAINPLHRNELQQWLAVWDSAGIMFLIEKLSLYRAFQRFIFQM
jgi:ferric-dicitrate binding protein FerR (iron transport regulator)